MNIDEYLKKMTGTTITEGGPVPNQQPAVLGDSRVAFIGEAPGSDEVQVGIPFCGSSGSKLDTVAEYKGILRAESFVGNVCQYQPKGNDFNQFEWNSKEVQDGIRQLAEDIAEFDPNIIVPLGNAALHLCTVGNAAPKKRAGKFVWPNTVSQWRGSLFWSSFFNRKAMATFHPAYVLRVYDDQTLFALDLGKAASESRIVSLTLPQRNLILPEGDYASTLCSFLDDIVDKQKKVSVDIEGGCGTMSCISFATSETDSFIVPFTDGGGRSYWPDINTEVRVWRAVARVLSNPAVPKVLQNSLYDNFVLTYSYATPILNVADDTMLKHWEAYCEMEKSLGLQASIYTREPFYKSERKSEQMYDFWRYCCKDSAVTYEINEVLSKQELTGGLAKQHYAFNLSLLPIMLYMEVQGMCYDKIQANKRLQDIRRRYYRRLHILNQEANAIPDNIEGWIRTNCCHKKDPSRFKSGFDGQRITTLLKQERTPEVLGELAALCKFGVNIDSPAQMNHFLYQQCQFPAQYKKEGNRNTDRHTSDALALLKLYKKNNDNKLLFNILTLRALKQQLENLNVKTDPDERVRCAYNVVGTNTGRLSCYESPTGSGFNLQTASNKAFLGVDENGTPEWWCPRDLLTAPEGYYIGQCDLGGADGWTVAAHCARLGDTTMLDDYRYGLKPAKVLALMYQRGIEVSRMSRDELKQACKEIDGDGWLYFACKRVQHGTNYGMAADTMSDQILRDSYKKEGKPVVVDSATCKQLQQLYLTRYRGVAQWQSWVKQRLIDSAEITAASGHTRHFFGRRKDHDTYKKGLAYEPQANTTYATNLAARRLWTDSDNRRSDANGHTALIIQPCHQVHDSLMFYFPIEVETWAVGKIKSYFDNEITIAGIPITIPYEGKYGLSWGKMDRTI